MTDLVSIIVPAYNSVPYIRECVESVLAQTYRNWELLLIDDGSQDLTQEVCRQLCEQDQRIRLLRQEHKGVSAARNAGIKNARGTFLFFLDSDDMIHPALIEALCRLLGKKQAAVAAEGWCYEKSRLCLKNRNWAWNDEEMQKGMYLTSDNAIYDFIWNTSDLLLRGIGGKMIRRNILKNIKFNEELSNGEDTLFIYQILIGGADVIILPYEWYYYRKHEKNASLICSISRIGNRYSVWQYIRNYEVSSNRMSNAAQCEVMRLNLIVKWYVEGVRRKDKAIKKYVKSLANSEKKLYIFFRTEWKIKLWVWLVLNCYPLYRMLRVLYRQFMLIETSCKTKYRRQKHKGKSMEKSRVGVITFHCADNYGAMLQAYGLKHYLCKKGIETDIVRYEPIFMTGRHWWIPYFPQNGIVRCLWYSANGWIRNLRMGEAFWARKRNMDSFRKNFLVEKKQKKIFFLNQFKNLSYSCYIVGSDQIWNPGITCGLRKAYFGTFKNQHKRKIVAYAASLGGASLESRYDREFSELIKYVDAVSVREREAVPYVQSLYKGAVTTVLDPVMLLDREDWYKIEHKPDREGYILVYMTERNDNLIGYAKSLSEHKKIPILELRVVSGVTDKDFLIDYSAGPAEFLGYIHKADYVVTNSLHGVAFSIIYQKKFMVFQHTKLGARISNLLSIHGLEHRIYERDSHSDIEDVIDWESVRKCTKDNVKMSEEFLVKHVGKQEVIE